MSRKKAVVLLSGGLDSTTALAVAKKDGFTCYALTISYGQRHHAELRAAQRIATQMGVAEHYMMPLDLRSIGGSALTSNLIAVPTGRSESEMSSSIPVTYVPARNTIFLSLALAYAEVIGAYDIYVGVNCQDYSGYPDCRPAFISAFEDLAKVATKAGVEGNVFRIHAPLIMMSKVDIIKLGVSLGVDYGLTHSCYNPSEEGLACRICDSCVLRRNGFEMAKLSDPTRYVA